MRQLRAAGGPALPVASVSQLRFEVGEALRQYVQHMAAMVRTLFTADRNFALEVAQASEDQAGGKLTARDALRVEIAFDQPRFHPGSPSDLIQLPEAELDEANMGVLEASIFK